MANPPAFEIDPNTMYEVTFDTTRGTIVTDLDPRLAPNTVNNFVVQARNGFYDGLTFHRVVPEFVIQGGDPEGSGRGGPGYKFADEPVKGEYTRRRGRDGQLRPRHQRLAVLHLHRRLPAQARPELQPLRSRHLGHRRRQVRPGRRRDDDRHGRRTPVGLSDRAGGTPSSWTSPSARSSKRSPRPTPEREALVWRAKRLSFADGARPRRPLRAAASLRPTSASRPHRRRRALGVAPGPRRALPAQRQRVPRGDARRVTRPGSRRSTSTTATSPRSCATCSTDVGAGRSSTTARSRPTLAEVLHRARRPARC